MTSADTNSPQRILVRGPNWLGDCVMAEPALAAIRAACPEAHLAVEARSGVAPVFGWMEAVDETIVCPEGGGLRNLKEKWAHTLAGRKAGFDTGVLLTNSFSTAFWMWRLGVPRRIGTAANGRSFLLTDRVILTDEIREGHQADWYRALASRLTETEASLRREPRLSVPDSVAAMGSAPAMGLWRGKHVRYAVLAPGSAYGPAKDWLHERFAALARRIVDEMGLHVLLSGSVKDVPACERIAAAAGDGVASMAGRTTLDSFLYLLSQAAGFVGNDSGAAHCAAGFGLPTVVIFGSTRPDRTRPLGPAVRTVSGEAACAPCLKRTCANTAEPMACMQSIPVEDVFRALVEAGAEADSDSVGLSPN